VGGRKVEGSIVNSVMGVLLLEDGDKDSYNGIQEFLLGRIRWFPAGDAVSYSAAGLAVGFGPPEVLNCGFLCDVKASHRRREFRRSFPCPTWCGGIGLVGGTWREGQTCQRGVCLVDAELPMTRAGARRGTTGLGRKAETESLGCASWVRSCLGCVFGSRFWANQAHGVQPSSVWLPVPLPEPGSPDAICSLLLVSPETPEMTVSTESGSAHATVSLTNDVLGYN
jgi:hypothetical protein